MLSVAIYITNGIITNRGPFNSDKGSNSPTNSYFSYNLDTWFRIKDNVFKEVHPHYGNWLLIAI